MRERKGRFLTAVASGDQYLISDRTMSANDVFLVSAARTPIGSFQGSLSAVTAPNLGAVAIREALKRGTVDPDVVEETFMGNVLSGGLGQAPARQAAKYADVPDKVPATTVSKVCGSGLQSIVFGAKSILLNDASVVIAGGMESMTNAPYILPKARGGFRMGNGEIVDSMINDGLWDPYNNKHMGTCGDLCAKEKNFSREAQDEFSVESYKRAQAAQKSGLLAQEIVPVVISGRKGDVTVDTDEEPTRAKFDKIPNLRPAFGKEGTVTAANASKLNDGAAAVVMASGDAVNKYGLKPMAKVVGYAGHAQAPEWFTTAPVGAINNLMAKVGWKTEDVDLFEINEAFAVVAMACAKETNIPYDKLNVRGGAVALGHPIGATGARLIVTLMHSLQERSLKRGVATLCIGGGEAVAVAIEMV